MFLPCRHLLKVLESILVLNSSSRPGSFLGSLSSLPGHQLGARVIEEVLARANVPSEEVSEVIMGQVDLTGSAHLCEEYSLDLGSHFTIENHFFRIISHFLNCTS